MSKVFAIKIVHTQVLIAIRAIFILMTLTHTKEMMQETLDPKPTLHFKVYVKLKNEPISRINSSVTKVSQ